MTDSLVEAELECRVCRSGAEEHRPLFHPCKCSGSIKYIHQDCLLEWIKFSNQSQPKCELCGEEFSFTPVYRQGAPQQLPLQEFIAAMVPHAGDAIRRTLRISLLTFLWVVVLPVVTSYAIDISNVFVFQETLQLTFSAPELWHAFWNGLLECILLLGLSTAVAHVWDGILRDARAQLDPDPMQQEADGGGGVIELFGRQWVPFDLARLNVGAADELPRQPGEPAPDERQQAADDPDGVEERYNVDDIGGGEREQDAVSDVDDTTSEAADTVDVLGGQEPQPQLQFQPQHEAQPPPHQDAAGNNNVAILPWEDNPDEGEEAWIGEFFDLDRPLTRSIARWLRMCMYNIAFIVAFEACPVHVGRTILANMGITLADVIVPVQSDDLVSQLNVTHGTVDPSEAEPELGISQTERLNMAMVHEYVTRRAFAVVCGAIGYGLIVMAVLATYCTYVAVQCALNEQYRQRHIQRARSVVASVLKWYKVASMILVKAFIIPVLMGGLLNVVTLKTCDATLQDRILRCQQMPLICGVMHWVIGVCFVLHVTSCTTELRKILRSDILAGVLPTEHEPGANVIETLASQQFLVFVQQSCFSLCFYILAVMLCVFLPVRIGHIFVPFAQPLQLRFEGLFLEIQLPFELLLSHVVLPLALERVNYRSLIGAIERAFMSASCAVLGLEDLLEPREQPGAEDDNRVPEQTAALPPAIDRPSDTSDPSSIRSSRPWWHSIRDGATRFMGYHLRYLILVLWTKFATVIAFSWAIRLPLAIGRNTLSWLQLPNGQDLYNATVGLILLGAAHLFLHYLWRECLAQTDLVAALRTTVKWAWMLGKVLVLAVLWLTVIPLMLGVIFELVLVIPLRIPVEETPKLPIAQCWALGLVSLKIWVRLVMLGAFGDTVWKRRFDRVRQNGVRNVQFLETLMEVFVPMFMGIGDFLFVPYLIGKMAATASFKVVPMASRIFRYSFAFYMMARIFLEAAELAAGQFKRMHDHIRDSRYLLGLELSNRTTELQQTQSETTH